MPHLLGCKSADVQLVQTVMKTVNCELC